MPPSRTIRIRMLLAAFAAGFVALGALVIFSPGALSAADLFIEHLILSRRQETLTAFFTGFTFLGGTEILTAGSVIAGMAFLFLYRRAFLPFLIAIIGSSLATTIMKLSLERARPEGGLVTEQTFAFPSGHTSNSTAFYGFLAFLLFLRLPRRWQRILLLAGTALFLLLMGASRIYLGVHFPSDVLAGYLLGGFWLLLAIHAYLRTKPSDHPPRQ